MRKLSSLGAAAAFLTGALLFSTPLLAQPPWAGGEGKGKGHAKGHDKGYAKGHAKGQGKGQAQGRDMHRDYFTEQHVVVVREYYDQRFQSGWCPPGLAKKRNGCMPPGQAKKWRQGHPLPRDVVYYDVPPDLVGRLGAPPAGHRYAQVGGDILLIAIGSGLVRAGIENLGR
jgi:Ni/Co efflux regulator RcnB